MQSMGKNPASKTRNCPFWVKNCKTKGAAAMMLPPNAKNGVTRNQRCDKKRYKGERRGPSIQSLFFPLSLFHSFTLSFSSSFTHFFPLYINSINCPHKVKRTHLFTTLQHRMITRACLIQHDIVRK